MIGISTRLMLTFVLVATPALAGDDDCAVVPMTDWQPREAVVKLAADQGWDLRRIRIDDGCYEVIGRDAEGRAIEIKLNPATLAVVGMEFEDSYNEGREPENTNQDD